jgi:CBS domain-containing protein
MPATINKLFTALTAEDLMKLFTALTAEDLMSRTPTVVPEQMSLRAAARVLSLNQISGAPVVDAQGRLVGVISTTDFMRCLDRQFGIAFSKPASKNLVCEWEVGHLEALPADAVRCCMTTDPVTASLETSITELARMMMEAHIHRVVVVDDKRRPIGVVSSTDVLAAVARLQPDGGEV